MMMNNNFSTAELDSASISNKNNNSPLEKPDPAAVSDFKQAMSQGDLSTNKATATEGKDASGAGADGAGKLDGDQMQKILMLLVELLAILTKSMKGGGESGEATNVGEKASDAVQGGAGAGKGAASATGDGKNAAKVENGKVVTENNVAEGNGQIPKPTEHKQSFELGGKQVVIGGDGSASAEDVQQTKDTLTNMYGKSDAFKKMIDSSPNDAFEVSVGKRDDNMSWGNADGRVFMNVNNIKAGANDGFEALTAHEFGHAGVGMEHGAEMKQFEQRVAREA